MKPPLVAALEDFRNILGICPCCGEFFRLTEIQIFYRARPSRTWFDKLEEMMARVERAEDRFSETEERIRKLARQRGRRQLPALLRVCEPILSPRGFFPQDAKALFDPVDFVIFDGMNRDEMVHRIVLLDGTPDSRARERIQRSIESVVHQGNYEWRTIRLEKNGQIVGADPPP